MKNPISCELMSEEQTKALRLKEQPYIIAISKKLFTNYGIKENHLEFELTVDKDKKLVLIGPTIQARPRGKPLVKGVDTIG